MAVTVRTVVQEPGSANTARSGERRGQDRAAFGRAGILRLNDDVAHPVTVGDLTRDGCRIETAVDLPPGTIAAIGLANVGLTPCRLVRRSRSGYGCVFLQPLSPGSVTAAFGPSNVAAFPVQATSSHVSHSDKWGRGTRLVFLAVAAAASWACVVGLGALAVG